MNLTYDRTHDVLFMAFGDGTKPVRTEEPAEGVVLEFEEDGRLAGMEILDASKRLDVERLTPVEFESIGRQARP